MILHPEDAARAIRSGRAPACLEVPGRLDLADYPGDQLPAGLRCSELDARNSGLTSLPADLRVEGRLVLDNSPRLAQLPRGLTAGSMSFRGCNALVALPERVNTWFLDLTGCSSFEGWPVEGEIHSGSVILRDCARLAVLPRWLGRLSQLDVAGCVRLREIPDGIKVNTWVDIGGSGITVLPPSLAGASLRWRGVRINERIAFHPEDLTARETLAEGNAERRRVMIERMGCLRFATEAGARTLDADTDRGGPRRLLSIDLNEDEPLVGLLCRCPSTGRQYLLRVPPDMKTCHQAAAWMAGFDDPSLYCPVIET